MPDASTSKASIGRSSGNIDDNDDDHGSRFKLIDVIFLPYNYVFKIMVLIAVLVKLIFGPMQAVYPFFYCDDYIEEFPVFGYIKLIYLYYSRTLLAVDIFLHIMHRQISDEAMKREYLPKSGLKILLDILAVIPICEVIAGVEGCPPIKMFPNILSLVEFIMAYRIIEFFDINGSHSILVIATGYLVNFIVVTNFSAVALLLFTKDGLCKACDGTNGIYDWRSYLMERYPDVNYGFNTYFYAVEFCLVYMTSKLVDELNPNTVTGFVIIIMVMLSGYALCLSIIMPKLFAENILRLKRINIFHQRARRVLLDTRRRNPSIADFESVHNFYNVLWQKRHGLTAIPEIISNLPRHMRIDISQDLIWAVFHHSPTLRNTSSCFKRWLCEHIRLQFKLPGEKFFVGPQCLTNLYYVKSGIVQFISSDDNMTALLSVSGGTVFGDVSFYNPPITRKVLVKCFTYCEIFVLSRKMILKGLHMFPEDRYQIMNKAKERIKHARYLYQNKMLVPNIDRSEKEGLMWIKTRWWEIFTYIENLKKYSQKMSQKCEIPKESAQYHCAKYIGQLVLSSEFALQKKSMFASTKFPWILMPDSQFLWVWSYAIRVTTFMVLILYPPHITLSSKPVWFKLLENFVDLMFTLDLFINLITSTEKLIASFSSFSGVILWRLKTPQFFLNVWSVLWLEEIVSLLGIPEYRDLANFNRLFKIYLFFIDDPSSWNWKIKPKTIMIKKLILFYVCFEYIFAYLTQVLTPLLGLTYGALIVPWPKAEGRWGVIISWISQITIDPFPAKTKIDLSMRLLHSVSLFFMSIFLRSRYMAIFYLNHLEVNNYQNFVTSLKQHYRFHQIHPDLLKRLNRYLTCHWKYFKGMDILKPNIVQQEPFDVFYKCHASLAEKVLSRSKMFSGADSSLVKDLAYHSKFLILPKGSTLSVFGVTPKVVIWLVNGQEKYEHLNENGQLVEGYRGSGQMLSMGSAFFGKPSMRTLSTATDCEIMYIPLKQFTKIYKRYPIEWGYIQKCKDEFSISFDKLFVDYYAKNRAYQKELRLRIFHAKFHTAAKEPEATAETLNTEKRHHRFVSKLLSYGLLEHPETKFIKWWMFFRVIIAFLMIVSSTFSGGTCAHIALYLVKIRSFCHAITILDIALKLFIPFYDDNGLVITDKRRCILHYLSRGFALDLAGILPLHRIAVLIVSKQYSQNIEFLLDNTLQFAHLYLITGYFNYLADVPSMRAVFILIIKSQVIVFLFFLASSSYLITKCVDFRWSDSFDLISMNKTDHCWLPDGFHFKKQLTVSNLQTIFAHALIIVQNAFFSINDQMYTVYRNDYDVFLMYSLLGTMFWYVFIYNQSLFMLYYRSSNIFNHRVTQLTEFLKDERVEKETIEKVVDHYNYLWVRTKGLNIQSLMSERIGMVFREDLNYYFYKKTLVALDSMVGGGESMQRRLANILVLSYFLPGEDIMREMDLVSRVYLVHRGNVLITQDGNELAVLHKGGIFGQFDTPNLRPVKVTATAIEHADVLVMAVKSFHETLTETEKANILRYPETSNDYMALTKVIVENPYNSVKFLLRGRKTIKLPRMSEPVEVDKSKCYKYYLIFVWLWVTTASVALTLFLPILHIESKAIRVILYFTDTIHLLNIVAEFYTMDLVVEGNKCVYKYFGWKNFYELKFYLDVVSLVVPVTAELMFGYVGRGFGMFRIIRLHHYTDFYNHFCKSFKNKTWVIIMQLVICLLVVHAMTCGWMFLACRNISDNPYIDNREIPPNINASINYDEWAHPFVRKKGCPRVTRTTRYSNQQVQLWFVTPKTWRVDYLMALTFIIIYFTRTNFNLMFPLSIWQTLYKVFISMLLCMGEIWISSVVISAIYTKYRESYQYAFDVLNLLQYLKQNGLSRNMLYAVRWYTKMLWHRQRGNWIPEMALQAPTCLREDIFSALYLHHLTTPKLFQYHLTPYFIRQLVVRLKRVVYFPGKFIVKDGDINPNIYFIHEGEVEKWYTDINGEMKMDSVLTMNGYFGLIPGLFPHTPFMFTYYSRTVCDMLTLHHDDWQDLLNGYPQIKTNLYMAAKDMKHKEHKKQYY